MVEGLLWYLDSIQVFYERLRDYKVNLSYSKWEVSVITKRIFPITLYCDSDSAGEAGPFPVLLKSLFLLHSKG